MKNAVRLLLGVVTSIGGFIEAGSISTSAQAGALFGLRLLWAIALAATCVAFLVEMSGRLTGTGTTLSLADVRIDRIDGNATGNALDLLQSIVPAPPPVDVLSTLRERLADSDEVPISVDKLSIESVTTSDAEVTIQFDFAVRAP